MDFITKEIEQIQSIKKDPRFQTDEVFDSEKLRIHLIKRRDEIVESRIRGGDPSTFTRILSVEPVARTLAEEELKRRAQLILENLGLDFDELISQQTSA